MINVLIDEFTPLSKRCTDRRTCPDGGNPYKKKIIPEKNTIKNGWYTNWESLADENEIYALVVEGSVDIRSKMLL